MKWPNHADYAEAVQNPELCFELPELHTGQVATTPLGLPRALSGNFATVYEIAGGGQTFAVRCFVRQVTNQQDRYAALERHLADCDLPFMVPFEFVPRGIRVHERWFPVVKMDWVSGAPLHTYVEQQLATPEKLAWLAADWREMMAELKRHRIGHGDLQHGNVLVTAEGDLRLVDYDGMYVPLFARERSPELGHANFQHPRRAADFYDERLDHFPELLIYLSLRALAAEPALWSEFFNGDNLIATAVDLRVPQCSSLWPRLLKSPDDDVRRLTVMLVDFLEKNPSDVPGLETLLSEHLQQVVVPERLEFVSAPLYAKATESASVPSGEADTEVEAFARRSEGPLAAMSIERTASGSRPAPPQPRFVDVFGWSALVTAMIAFVPPLRSVAGFAAIGLSLLAWLMPGRLWQRARVAASLAAVIGVLSVFIAQNVRVAARLQHPGAPLPLQVETVENITQVATAGPIAQPPDAVLQAAIPILKPAPFALAQPVSRPLIEPVKQAAAEIVQRWKPHSETVSALALSSDGRYLVSSSSDRSMGVWSLVRNQLALTRTNLAEPLIALTSLTNLGIVTTLDAMHQLQWWSLDGGVPLKSHALDPDSLVPPAISPNGQVIVLGGKERRQIVLHYNTTPPSSAALGGLSSWVKLVRFAPDSLRFAVVCHDDSISLRQTASGAVLQALSFPDATIAELEFSNDGSQLLALGEQGQARLWTSSTGAVIGETRLPLNRPVASWLRGKRGNTFVAAAGHRILLLATAPAIAVEKELRSDSPVTALASLPDGSGFVTGLKSGEIAIWQFNRPDAGGIVQFARP